MSLVPPPNIRRLLDELTTEYQENLHSSQGEKYLLERGITKEAQSYFRLGFVVDPREEERFYDGMVSIPFIVGRHIVGIKYRRIDEREPKYLSSVGFDAHRIFNPNILKGLHPKIYVCEGEIDAITLHSLGVPAIGIPGANSWNPVIARALRNRRVVVLADGDGKPGKGAEAGAKLGKQVLTAVDDSGMIIMEGTDVNQYLIDHGKEKLFRYIGWKE